MMETKKNIMTHDESTGTNQMLQLERKSGRIKTRSQTLILHFQANDKMSCKTPTKGGGATLSSLD